MFQVIQLYVLIPINIIIKACAYKLCIKG